MTEDYTVGRGRPPRNTRWKPGDPSPNPRGRPRKEQSMDPDVRKAFERAISKKIVVSRGEKKVQMTRIEAGLEQLLNQFAKGDRHARRDLMDYAERLNIDFLAQHRQALEQALTPNYQTILDSYLARHSSAGAVASAERVLAPPELLDDDDAEEREATPPVPPKAETKPEPDPPHEFDKPYPKPFSQMTPMAKWAWYPKWCAEHPERCAEPAKFDGGKR